MISDARKYISDAIKRVSSDFKEHPDGFAVDNIGRVQFDLAFHSDYAGMTLSSGNQTCTDDSLSMRVQLCFKGFRDVQTAIDKAWNTSNQVRLEMMRTTFAKTGAEIKDVIVQTIDVEPLPTNDNSMIATLVVRFRFIFEVPR